MENKEEIELFSSVDEYEIKQVCFILTEHNVPFIRKDDGSGSYMNLYMGHSIQTKRIFVNGEDFEKAKDLLSSFLHEEKSKENKDTTSDGKYTTIRRIFGLLILVMPILMIVLLILFS